MALSESARIDGNRVLSSLGDSSKRWASLRSAQPTALAINSGVPYGQVANPPYTYRAPAGIVGAGFKPALHRQISISY